MRQSYLGRIAQLDQRKTSLPTTLGEKKFHLHAENFTAVHAARSSSQRFRESAKEPRLGLDPRQQTFTRLPCLQFGQCGYRRHSPWRRLAVSGAVNLYLLRLLSAAPTAAAKAATSVMIASPI
jgi:hypothetical protein